MPSHVEIESSIVRVLDAQGAVVGTGFVADNGLILTCAHVITAAKMKPGDVIQIALHTDDGQRDAHIVPEWWRDPDAEDVAVLQPTEPLPKCVQPLLLGPAKVSRGHEFYSRGYRLEDQFPQGLDAEGRIQSLTTHHGQSVLQLLTNQIDQGMSGAPIFDTQTQRVVGMANFFWKTTRQTDGWLSGAVPGETLQVICSALTLHPPQPVEDYLTAVREYCANLPYLTLHDIRPPKTLDEVYVPLKARPQPRKDENKPKEEQERFVREAQRHQSLSVTEVMQSRDAPHVLILGEPGAGKSTLLRQMAERAWDAPQAIGLSEPHLPLLVPLRHLVASDGSLEKRLSHALASEMSLANDLPDGFLAQWPQQTGTRWLILLDALDEVSDSERAHLMQWLKGQLQNLREHRVVITSRPTGYKDDFDTKTFGHYDLLPFTAEQTSEFARKWFNDKADAFLKELDRIHTGEMRGTPLLLTIAAKVFGEISMLPECRSGLYEQFVKLWLDEAHQRDQSHELSHRLWDVALFVLARFALALTEQPDSPTEQELSHVAADYLSKELDFKRDEADVNGRKLVYVLARRSGVFIRRADAFQFIHPTFREYLAAFTVVQACNYQPECAWQRAICQWDDSKWRETALFGLSILSNAAVDVTALLNSIVQSKNEEALYFAGASVADKAKIAEGVANIIIDELARKVPDFTYYEGGRRWDGRRSLEILAEIRSYPRVPESLLRLARDSREHDTEILYSCVQALGRLGCVGDLRELSCNETVGDNVRVAAASTLGGLGYMDEAVFAGLLLARRNSAEVSAHLSIGALLAKLCRIDDLRLLIQDKSIATWIRFQIIISLGERGEAYILPDIEQIIQTGSNDWVVIAARQAADRIRARFGIQSS